MLHLILDKLRNTINSECDDSMYIRVVCDRMEEIKCISNFAKTEIF